MSEELKPCEHGRNFCMDCHYPKGKFKTLPAMYDGLAAENQRLRTELAALKAGQGEAVAWMTGPVVWGSEAHAINHARAHRMHVAPLYTAPSASADAVSVPAAMPERWEDRLSRMHQTIQAGCWPKRWVDDAKDYELGELRALLARQEVKS